ncbi:IpaD/SipD/SspD family type III secretion system needle tip protein [Enterobacter mori]|uniref:IpaD/SipD/SspD family type III secretion system needle tip protein n=1 Tax=Enterobacter mori TaxID=539813 RepID=UPI001B8BEC91|nr:IpaD/SipD/SspD family type III secretion system needle tip protein [Enterobacter mori]MBS3050400.1 IpaD/SipD/SspD family type III secretion system needle tip protein [Enterobacter mori]
MITTVDISNNINTVSVPQEKQNYVVKPMMILNGVDFLTLSNKDKRYDPYTLAENVLFYNDISIADAFFSMLWGEGTGALVTEDDVKSTSLLLDLELKESDKLFDSVLGQYRRGPKSTDTPEHIGLLEDMINNIHFNYQKIYAEINKAAAEAMKVINDALAQIYKFVSTGSDGNIKFDKDGFEMAWRSAVFKYGNATEGVTNTLSAAIHTFPGDKDQYDFWKKKLGSNFVVQFSPPSPGNPNGTIAVFISGDMLSKVTDTIKNAQSGEVPNAIFQTFQQAIDSHKNAFNNGVSQLLERFRQDNSVFDSLIQLLTRLTEDLHRYNAGYMS